MPTVQRSICILCENSSQKLFLQFLRGKPSHFYTQHTNQLEEKGYTIDLVVSTCICAHFLLCVTYTTYRRVAREGIHQRFGRIHVHLRTYFTVCNIHNVRTSRKRRHTPAIWSYPRASAHMFYIHNNITYKPVGREGRHRPIT